MNDSTTLSILLIVQARPFCAALCSAMIYYEKTQRRLDCVFLFALSQTQEKLPFYEIVTFIVANVALFAFAFDLFLLKVEQALSLVRQLVLFLYCI